MDAGADAGLADGGSDAGFADAGSDAGPTAVAPSGLFYPTNPAVYTLGQPITDNVPSSAGGAVVSYAIVPSLKAGLIFSTTTGIISGTPTSLSVNTLYTVTATNLGGSTTATLFVTVNDVAPSGLTYSTATIIYTKGTAITANTPSSSGGPVVSYAITPTLPTGLSLSTTTGVVSGTPTVLSSQTSYTITATNSGGSTLATLFVTVNDVAPSGLAYAANSAVYTKGLAITNDTPSSGGGTVLSYAINPGLPAGLAFSTATGFVSGTPTALSSQTNYTVTATNSGGFTTAMLHITVNDVAPSGLAYSTNPAVYTKGTAITANSPSLSGGGPVISCGISPTLPSGLGFSTTTGIVSGTPTALSTATTYTVTATNSGGSATATLSLTVNDAPPSNLTYSLNPAVYSQGTAIAANTPSISGGPVTLWGISSALPAGLAFSTTAGNLSGTPTALSSLTTYTVTATNSGGSTTATLTITVTVCGALGQACCGSACTADGLLTCNTSSVCEPALLWTQWQVPLDAPPDSDYAVSSGTVTDSKTGLVWQQGTAPNGASYTYAQAQAYCTGLNSANGGSGIGGYTSGWRLPEIDELLSLVNLSKTDTSATIDLTAFPGTPASVFWSNSIYAQNTGSAWFVTFDLGSSGYNAVVGYTFYVRCVR